MKTRKAICWVILLMAVLAPRAGADDRARRIAPSPVPVNIKPIDYNETLYGAGYNITTITSDWNDPFFKSGEEKIGEIEYTVHHLVVGVLKSASDVSATEYDLLIGRVESKARTKQYFSPVPQVNQRVNIDHTGSGYDIGARIVSSKTLHKQLGRDGKRFIDWNYALSLHAAWFSTDGTFSGRSTDGQFVEVYDEEESGIFLRPVIALQPIIRLTDGLSLVPYAALGTKLTLSYYYWVDKEYIWMGASQPGQMTEGEGFYSTFSGMEATVGFDIGIILSSDRKHGLTIGGALSQMFGDQESDFREVHVLYTFPM